MIYHRDIGFPSTFRRPIGQWTLAPTKHARVRAEAKSIVLPSSINLSEFDLIEIEIINGRITKLIVRKAYNDLKDIVMVLSPYMGKMGVRTVWLNDTDDQHRTLDYSVYARP